MRRKREVGDEQRILCDPGATRGHKSGGLRRQSCLVMSLTLILMRPQSGRSGNLARNDLNGWGKKGRTALILGVCAMYEDTYSWPIKCPVCLNEVTEQVGSMKAGKEVRCTDPVCRVRFACTVKQFKRELAEHRRLGLNPYLNFMRLNEPL
jgi:hypothetical protein